MSASEFGGKPDWFAVAEGAPRGDGAGRLGVSAALSVLHVEGDRGRSHRAVAGRRPRSTTSGICVPRVRTATWRVVGVARRLLTLVYYGLRDGEIRCVADRDAA
jgi:hypothetical protein